VHVSKHVCVYARRESLIYTAQSVPLLHKKEEKRLSCDGSVFWETKRGCGQAHLWLLQLRFQPLCLPKLT
jgi:hypothetical protein